MAARKVKKIGWSLLVRYPNVYEEAWEAQYRGLRLAIWRGVVHPYGFSIINKKGKELYMDCGSLRYCKTQAVAKARDIYAKLDKQARRR